jgi:hypothetical protein
MKVGNYEVTFEALWPVPKLLTKRDGPKAPTTVHGTLGLTCNLNKNANVNADYLENRFTSHDLSNENHKRRLETRIQVLLAFVDDTLLRKVRHCDIHKLTN